MRNSILRVGSRRLGKLGGIALTVDEFCCVLRRWRACLNPVDVDKRWVLFLSVPLADVLEPRDWVLAVVCARDGRSFVGEAWQFEVTVCDRLVRKTVSGRIARYVRALFRDGAGRADPVMLQEDLPGCVVAAQRIGCVLGVIVNLVQARAQQVHLD